MHDVLHFYFRELCELIGDKTNVYSLEVSMWGHEMLVEKSLSKREMERLAISEAPMVTKTISYSKEDCKLMKIFKYHDKNKLG